MPLKTNMSLCVLLSLSLCPCWRVCLYNVQLEQWIKRKKIQIKPPVTGVDNVKTHFAHTLSLTLTTIKTENLWVRFRFARNEQNYASF